MDTEGMDLAGKPAIYKEGFKPGGGSAVFAM